MAFGEEGDCKGCAKVKGERYRVNNIMAGKDGFTHLCQPCAIGAKALQKFGISIQKEPRNILPNDPGENNGIIPPAGPKK